MSLRAAILMASILACMTGAGSSRACKCPGNLTAPASSAHRLRPEAARTDNEPCGRWHRRESTDGGTQSVQFGEIWRIRRAFASDEPAGTTVVDFANNRLFVATPLAGLVSDVGKKIPLVQFTAPNGEAVYMAASKVTDISNALPGLHNPLSKTVIGTRDGTQQVTETAGDVKRIVEGAHTAP